MRKSTIKDVAARAQVSLKTVSRVINDETGVHERTRERVRKAIAESLNRRFDMGYTADYIFPTTGAAGALAHALRVVTKPGDEVITSPFTFAATAEVIVLLGGKPVWVDVEADTGLIDATQIEAAITPRT